MSHATVLVIGPDIEKQLLPFCEHDEDKSVRQYMEFVDHEAEAEKEWNEGTLKIYDWHPDIHLRHGDVAPEQITRLKAGGLLSNFELSADIFGKAPKTGQRVHLMNLEEVPPTERKDGSPLYRTVDEAYAAISNVKVLEKNKRGFVSRCSVTLTLIDPPPVKTPQQRYGTLNEFMHEYHGYTERDPEKNRFGYWRNPNAKWDWYQVGGRWTGFFKLKDGATGTLGKPGLLTETAESGYVDATLKGNVDWEGMRNRRGEEAGKTYDKYQAELFKINNDSSLDEKTREARKKGARLTHYFVDEVPASREAAVEAAHKRGAATFAVLRDGRWYERGKLGWWGAVHGEKDESAWVEEWEKLVLSLPDDTQLTVVDYHI